MKNSHSSSHPGVVCRALSGWVLPLLLWSVVAPVFAGLTDISSAPLANTTSAQVKPNIMLLMDTSGSMGWGHMPDQLEDVTLVGSVGYKSAVCNLLYYNPTQNYSLPKLPDGSEMTAPSFTSAPYSGYTAYSGAPSRLLNDGVSRQYAASPANFDSAGNVNLSTSFKAYDDYTLRQSGVNDTAQPAYYYKFTPTTGTVTTLPYGSSPCTDVDGGFGTNGSKSTTGGTWTRVIVGATSGTNGTDERQKFANWYTYYRTRIALTKSAASLAFTPLTDSFRVGFITVLPRVLTSDNTGAFDTNKYLAINDFDITQRVNWYNKLFAQTPGGASPAREGLARVGRHYGGKHDLINAGMAGDPIQYSCQQNFTIMTTDGYWNDQAESSGGGPLTLDGKGWVGQQDGVLTDGAGLSPRPIWDGSATMLRTETDKSNLFDYGDCTATVSFAATSQIKASTYQTLQTTKQTIQTAAQFVTSTEQDLESKTITTKTTTQTSKKTEQYVSTTSQFVTAQTQTALTTQQTTKTTEQYTSTTVQNVADTYTISKSTTQTQKVTEQYASTTSQFVSTTSQFKQGQTQYTTKRSQTLKRVFQNVARNDLTELETPVDTCVAQGVISCKVNQISAAAPTSDNCPIGTTSTGSPQYIKTTCSVGPSTDAAPVPVASCVQGSSSSGAPNYITTTCTLNTLAAEVPVASCSPGTTSSGSPNYIITTCSQPAGVNNQATPMPSCTLGSTSSGAPNYVTTTCAKPAGATNATTYVLSCTVGTTAGTSPNYITTVCSKPSANNQSVYVSPASACVAQSPTSSNSYVRITCTTNPLTGPTVVDQSTCTAGNGTSPSYIVTTCTKTVVTGATPVASCAPSNGSSPDYIATNCTKPAGANNATSFVASCVVGSTSSGSPNYITTTCAKPAGANNTSTYVLYSTCTANIAPTSGNSYLRTTCSTVTLSGGPTNYVASCTASNGTAANSYVRTICTTTTSASTPVASCTLGSSNSGPPNYITTTCSNPAGPNNAATPVASCTVGSTNSGAPNFITTTCSKPVGANNQTVYVSPASACVNQNPLSGNSYMKITCSTSTLSGPAVVDVATCNAGNGSAPDYIVTSCVQSNTQTDKPVATCIAGKAGSPNYEVISCRTATTPAVGIASCTLGTTTDENFVRTTCSKPAGTNYSKPQPSASCVAAKTSANSANGYITIDCQTTSIDIDKVVATCATSVGASPDYIETTCRDTTPSAGVAAASCSETTAADLTKTKCTTAQLSAPTPVPTCNQGTGPGPDYVQTACSTGPATGRKRVYSTTTSITKSYFSGGIAIGTPTVSTSTGSQTDLDGVCYVAGVSNAPSLPTPNPQRPGAGDSPVPPTGCTAWPCTAETSVTGGSANSLADVAQYYYRNDLRPASDWPDPAISKDNVKFKGQGPEDDRAEWQHMTTFTIGLGVSGVLNYDPAYRSSSTTTGDFADIRTGAKSWPIWPDPSKATSDPTVCNKPWDDTKLTYPCKDDWNDPRSIDDFWHTAVNGRGQYFSAADPTSVIAGLNGALARIAPDTGSGAAAATSTLQPVSGDNTVYVASYTTGTWVGDVQALSVDPTTGAVSNTAVPIWSAQSLLDAKAKNACDNRSIYLMRQGATNNMVAFTWNTKVCDNSGVPSGDALTQLDGSEQAYFGDANVRLLSQYPDMSSGTNGQRANAVDANLVNFVRGQRGLEDYTSNDITKLYRKRDHILGDIVNGGPVYVRKPTATYQDAGYADFKAAQDDRTPMVYVPANDGMLHAFYAGTSATDPQRGKEAWAIIPSAVLPNLYKLADANYANTHQYFVDGAPTVGDAYDASQSAWRTILVGGLNFGGRAYYAIDITDPASPKVLWEFKRGGCYANTDTTAGADCYLGYTFGKPVITKIVDSRYPGGRWVVMVTSGYNNVRASPDEGDGKGYLYVLDAFNGQIIYRIATSAGSDSTPSGLAQINNFVDDVTASNLAVRVYGTDMLGNVWRFDVNDNLAPSGREASLIGTTKDSSGNVQPISTRPELAELNGQPMVFVATGRLLGATDVTDKHTQSIYGIVDPLTGSPAYTDLRSSMARLTMTQGGSTNDADVTRTIACSGETSNCSSTNGWVVDLPDSGERVNVNMKLQFGTLVIASNVPTNSACDSGGYGWFNYLNFSNGLAVTSSSGLSISQYEAGSLIVGFNVLTTPGGDTVGNIRTAAAKNDKKKLPIDPIPPAGKRISWREIAQ